MWDELVQRLKACGIPFADTAWDSRPAGDFGVYSQDFGVEQFADDTVINLDISCSVDLYLRSRDSRKTKLIQDILSEVVGTWELNSIQYETDTHLLHYEYVFEVEGDL